MLLLVALLCLVLGYILFRRSISHLLVIDTMFPGPTGLPILGNALSLLINSEDFLTKVVQMVILYRRSFRVWVVNRVFVGIIDEKDIETILSSNTHIDKSETYQFLLPWIGDGLLTSTGSKWRQHRKILTPAFHFKILDRFIHIFNKNGDILCDVLSEVEENTVFNVYNYIKLYALDNICETAMGTQINAQKSPNSDYVRAVKDMCMVVFRRSLSAWLRPDFIYYMSKYGRLEKQALSVIHGMTNEVIKKRKDERKLRRRTQETSSKEDAEGAKERNAFLDILLECAEEQGLTDEDIREEVDTFMFEGHDTITSAISFALFNLAQHQAPQAKAFKEQMEIFGEEDRPASMRDLNEMKYLEQVIKESLRLYPSVPLIARLITEDLKLDEFAYLPKGTQAVIALGLIHRNERFWDKPHDFIPERFSPEASVKRHPFVSIPFSAGPRNCIGQKFAMLEMKSALSKLIKHFKILPSLNPKDQPRPIPELVLTSANGINIRLQRRTIGHNIQQVAGS